MKILILVNWKIEKPGNNITDMQSSNYALKDDYWFFSFFKNKPIVRVIGINSNKVIEFIEKKIFHFYVWQFMKSMFLYNKYDLIIAHGMPSGILFATFKRIFRIKKKLIIFDIGSFSSASTKGLKLRLSQFSSKSIDYVIYHTKSQKLYYEEFFPWIAKRSSFIQFGINFDFFDNTNLCSVESEKTILCVGYSLRDWNTLVSAFLLIPNDGSVKLKIVGKINRKWLNQKNIIQVGFLPINKLKIEIKKSMFCILPLEDYNFSYGQMTLLQEMALKKCVLAANVRSLKDYAIDGETVFFYTPKNVIDCKNKIQFLINNPDIREKIAYQSYLYVKNYNEKDMAILIEDIINGVCKK